MEEKMKVYFDCFSGISGDMTLGAFVSLGVPLCWLCDELGKLAPAGIRLTSESVIRSGITAQSVAVHSDETGVTRHFADIKALIDKSHFSSRVKNLSLEIFKRLANAEAKIHDRPRDHVHFHEVGGIDAIADIVGTALCVEYLGIDKIVSSPIPLGRGFVSCCHGILPLPAPATLALLKGVPVVGSDVEQELVTPTGAAIITTLAESFGDMPPMIIDAVGYGAGKREHESIPNLLRIVSGRNAASGVGLSENIHTETISVVETCIDDMNPEYLGYLMDRLYADGALEVYLIPYFTKKNRAGTMLQVLCREPETRVMIGRILSESTSLGVRHHRIQREVLAREIMAFESSFGEVTVKRVTDPSGDIRIVPEYDVCSRIAGKHDIPLRTVYDNIAAEVRRAFFFVVGELTVAAGRFVRRFAGFVDDFAP